MTEDDLLDAAQGARRGQVWEEMTEAIQRAPQDIILTRWAAEDIAAAIMRGDIPHIEVRL